MLFVELGLRNHHQFRACHLSCLIRFWIYSFVIEEFAQNVKDRNCVVATHVDFRSFWLFFLGFYLVYFSSLERDLAVLCAFRIELLARREKLQELNGTSQISIGLDLYIVDLVLSQCDPFFN